MTRGQDVTWHHVTSDTRKVLDISQAGTFLLLFSKVFRRRPSCVISCVLGFFLFLCRATFARHEEELSRTSETQLRMRGLGQGQPSDRCLWLELSRTRVWKGLLYLHFISHLCLLAIFCVKEVSVEKTNSWAREQLSGKGRSLTSTVSVGLAGCNQAWSRITKSGNCSFYLWTNSNKALYFILNINDEDVAMFD